MRAGLVTVSIVGGALVLGGCTSSPASDRSDDETPTTSATTATATTPTATPTWPPGEMLVEVAESELGADVLPDGFTYINSVDVDASGAVSHVYGGARGPQGPTLYIHTGLTSTRPNEAMAGLEQERVLEVGGTFPVTVARDTAPGTWTFVTIDASPAGVVRVIGKEMSDADVLDVVDRLTTSTEAA